MAELDNTKQETSKGATEKTSQGATPDPKTVEGSPQWVKSQLDKMRAENEQKLAEKENAWLSEKQQLTGQLQQVLQEVTSSKTPKQTEELKAPVLTDPDDPTAQIKYLQEVIEYKDKIAEKRFNQFEERFGKTEDQLRKEKEFQENLRNLEIVKTSSKSIWLGEGLSPEEAEECWNWQSTVRADERIKTIGKMFKLSKGNGQSDIMDEMKRREGLKMDGVPPGAGAGGGAGSTINPNEYVKGKDHRNLYQKKT